MESFENKIIIDLEDSTYAHGFKAENQIHVRDLEKCMRIIRTKLNKLNESDDLNDEKTYKRVALDHCYDTIGVFGERGSGKTSFMISLLETCETELPDAIVLKIIDPTLMEHKKPMVLSVLAMINQLVSEKLQLSECSVEIELLNTKKAWDKIMKDVATGLIAIDKVGDGYESSLWHDESYVLHTGLHKVEKANDFESSIRKMLSLALSILQKKAFILAFDDIDVDIQQGWEVLETLRRYFSDRRIISIISGNIKLYGMIVRNKLSSGLTIKDEVKRETMANELESQYMLKLLSPDKRINLVPLKILLQNKNKIEFSSGKMKSTPDEVYCGVLERFGIRDNASKRIYIDFLESMSLRSQINFVKSSWSNDGSDLSLDVFASRLYAAGVDLDVLKLNASLMNITILEYLLEHKNLPDCYLLLPTLSEKDINSNFVAFAFIESNHFKTKPYLIFDYILRIGYLRNIVLPITDYMHINGLIKYAGWNQIMSLKNNIGLTMAYISLKDKVNETIALSGLQEPAKMSTEEAIKKNAIDAVLKLHPNNLSRLLAMFPFIRISKSSNNESRSFYSPFALLAVICEILKCDSEDSMKSRINDLKLFRTYPMPREGEVITDESEIYLEIETDPAYTNELAKKMWSWKNSYKESYLPLYALGRIVTRFYNSAINVDKTTVGSSMNIMISALFNSCLIEECKVRIEPSKQAELNNGNPRKDTKIFTDNLSKSDIVSRLEFSKWLMGCPMLNCFLEVNVFEKIIPFLAEEVIPISESYKVYDILSEIKVKDNKDKSEDSLDEKSLEEKPVFSGSKVKWRNSLKVMKDKGISDEQIEKHIVSEPDINKAKAYIISLNLFQRVHIDSVEKFRNYYIYIG